jgi:hypothetical protein
LVSFGSYKVTFVRVDRFLGKKSENKFSPVIQQLPFPQYDGMVIAILFSQTPNKGEQSHG